MRINIHDLRERLKSAGVNQSALAKAIGVSASAISHYMKGSYPGDVPNLEAKIADWIKLQQDRAAAADSLDTGSLVETTPYKIVYRTLRIAETRCAMGVITGRPGVGKTFSIHEYKRRHPSMLLIQADPTCTSKSLLEDLCELLNLDTRGTLHTLFKRVTAKLSGSGRLIVIDEAENLQYRVLEVIRRIYDKTKIDDKPQIGVGLVGTRRLKANLQGNPNFHEQLYRRISIYRNLDDLEDGDIDRMIFARLGEIDKDSNVALRKACGRSAGALSWMITWCHDLTKINAIPLTPDVVAEAASMGMFQ